MLDLAIAHEPEVDPGVSNLFVFAAAMALRTTMEAWRAVGRLWLTAAAAIDLGLAEGERRTLLDTALLLGAGGAALPPDLREPKGPLPKPPSGTPSLMEQVRTHTLELFGRLLALPSYASTRQVLEADTRDPGARLARLVRLCGLYAQATDTSIPYKKAVPPERAYELLQRDLGDGWPLSEVSLETLTRWRSLRRAGAEDALGLRWSDPDRAGDTDPRVRPPAFNVDDMRLTDQEASRFYAAWWPLLGWINERLGIAPAVTRFPCAVEDALEIRDALWAHDDLRLRFVAENPAGLPADQLALVASWQHRRVGTFIVWKHYKKHTVLLGQGEPNERFSRAGRMRHVCRDCAHLGPDELAYRQHVRNIERLLGWDRRVQRRQRAPFQRYLAHPDPRVRQYAERIQESAQREQQRWREALHADAVLSVEPLLDILAGPEAAGANDDIPY